MKNKTTEEKTKLLNKDQTLLNLAIVNKKKADHRDFLSLISQNDLTKSLNKAISRINGGSK